MGFKTLDVKASIYLKLHAFFTPPTFFFFFNVFKSGILISILSTAQEGGEVFSSQGIIKRSDRLSSFKARHL